MICPDVFWIQLNGLKESIRLELTVRKEYSEALQQMDVNWWENEIRALDQRIANEKESFRRFALMRIRGFLGIITFSLTNNSLKQNNMNDVQRLLRIYELLEPGNPVSASANRIKNQETPCLPIKNDIHRNDAPV